MIVGPLDRWKLIVVVLVLVLVVAGVAWWMRQPSTFALSVNAAGGATVRTVVLLTPEEVDAAAKRSVDYRPPGS